MQTWKNTIVPDIWKRGQDSVQTMFPDWTYVYMTDFDNEEFVKTNFPEHLRAFKDLKYNIQRADVIRYMWLYVHGGLYIDMDYEVLRDIRGFLEAVHAPLFVLHSPNVSYVLTNSLIVAKPKLGIFMSLIARCLYGKLPWYYMGKHIEVMFSTGPMAFHDIINHSDVPYVVLPRKLFLPEDDSEPAFTKALQGGTWNAVDSFTLNFILKYRTEIALCLGAAILYFARGFLQYRERVAFLLRHLSKLKKKE